MEYEDRRKILTPEGVQLALPLAALGSRFVAIVIDLAIGAVAALHGPRRAGRSAGARRPGSRRGGLLVFYIGYQVVFEVSAAAEGSASAPGLRVVTDGGPRSACARA